MHDARGPGRGRLWLVATRRALLGDRVLEVGDVLDFDPSDRSVIVCAPLEYHAADLCTLLDAGAVRPQSGTADEIRRLLIAPPLRLL